MMFRLAWATDVHLDHADDDARERFAREIKSASPDALAITGDIANARLLESRLAELQLQIGIPIYFNLGNHDFYGGSIVGSRQWAADITLQKDQKLIWIEQASVVPLSLSTCLIGIDGWGDGILGAPERSNVMLYDWEIIHEFRALNAMVNRGSRRRLLQKLGEDAAQKLRPTLAAALNSFDRVILMTHVPPWKEATWHQGNHSNDDWLPWFSCKAVGDVIVQETALHAANKHVMVICGHTHGFGHSVINNQVEVHTGGAQYASPEVQYVFEIYDNSSISAVPIDLYFNK